MVCYLCGENSRDFFGFYCPKCNNIKRLIALYGLDRVYEIMEFVLVRTEDQQAHKIKIQLKKEQTLTTAKLEEASVITRSKIKN